MVFRYIADNFLQSKMSLSPVTLIGFFAVSITTTATTTSISGFTTIPVRVAATLSLIATSSRGTRIRIRVLKLTVILKYAGKLISKVNLLIQLADFLEVNSIIKELEDKSVLNTVRELPLKEALLTVLRLTAFFSLANKLVFKNYKILKVLYMQLTKLNLSFLRLIIVVILIPEVL